MAQAGYSQTPLLKKLGYAGKETILLIDLPDHLIDVIATPLGSATTMQNSAHPTICERLQPLSFSAIHYFTESKGACADILPLLMSAIARDGMIWISWPKKASRRPTDMSEDVIRQLALPLGLVDIKVCAVDEIWSGLKLVIRKERR